MREAGGQSNTILDMNAGVIVASRAGLRLEQRRRCQEATCTLLVERLLDRDWMLASPETKV